MGFRWLGAEANKGMTAEWRVTIQDTKPQAALPDKQANSSCSSLVVATLAVPVALARAATTAAAAAPAVATTTVAAAATCEERGASGTAITGVSVCMRKQTHRPRHLTSGQSNAKAQACLPP